MAAKRALIVDDSKSARVVLSRMLQKYGIDTDAVESAETAIEYLTQHRPDVIFMDHLMPGMDGFQAVQAIKNNPQTATIPIMMYTSQQGELYVGQARALGAVGVLPKLVKPIDVSKVLYQLHLLPDRRDTGPSAFVVANPPETDAAESQGEKGVAPQKPSTAGFVPADWHPQLESALRNHDAELRRFVVASLDSYTDRVTSDIRNMIAETPVLQTPPPLPEPRPPYLWIAAVVAALLPGILLAVFYTRALDANGELAAENARLKENNTALSLDVEQLTRREAQRREAELLASELGTAGAGQGQGQSPDNETAPMIEPVRYGEIPLAGGRLEALRDLLARLEAQAFKGEVQIESFAGEFCLKGNSGEGYELAPPDLPVTRCDLIGNPFDDSLTPAQRQSLSFANLMASVRQRSGGNLSVTVKSADGKRSKERLIAAYPRTAAGVTASQWNEAALRNNRVEFRAIPGP